jgi:adenylate cyclase
MTPRIEFRQLVLSMDTGVAVADPESWEIGFVNAKFFQWFPGDEVADEADSLVGRLPGFDPEKARARLSADRTYGFETESAGDRRAVPLRVECRMMRGDAGDLVVVECRDASKEKETQYMLDSYSKMAEKSARDLQKEKERVERLLLNIMPKSVFEELRDYGTSTPARFESATILMLDFVGFTDMAIASDPSAIVAELNDIFSAFDRITEMFDCERLRTIGDAYMAVSGLPEPNPDHAANIAKVALRMRRYLERRNAAHPQEWLARFGINTGSVIGSLVGVQKYVYDLFGPGINLAARMETVSEAMKITVNQPTAELLEDEFILTERGEFEIKGFGMQTLFFLEGERHDRI